MKLLETKPSIYLNVSFPRRRESRRMDPRLHGDDKLCCKKLN